MKIKKAWKCFACLVSFLPNISFAEPIPRAGQAEADWRYTLALYAFLPARTSGTSTVAGTSVPLDLDLGDALDLLDIAAAGRFEAWRGDWGFIVDANYVGLEAKGALPLPNTTFEADIRQRWLGFMASYRVSNTRNSAGNRQAVDLHFGLRYNALKQEISVNSPAPLPKLGGDEKWWEPVIGARGMWELNEKWAVIASADLGGFGAGGNDLQVGINAGFDWKAWEKTSIFFGYRYFSMDFSTSRPDGKFAYDVQQHGPVAGVKFRF